jgi:DHA2 family multidrug resistance protein
MPRVSRPINDVRIVSGMKARRTSGALLFAEFTGAKVGLLGALCLLILLDGANGAMSSTLGPYLMGTFAATRDQIAWTAVFYFATKLYALLLAARVQERFGQRSSLLVASAVLVWATASSVLVTAYPLLLVMRFFQGISGGLVLALGQGALLGAFPRREQPLVQGVFALAAVVFPATIVPAFLGGYAYGSIWQFAYLWMTFLGLAGWLWLFWNRQLLGTTTSAGPVPIGRIAMLGSSLLAIAYVLQQGDRYAWLESPYIVWSTLLVVVCLLGLGFMESSGGPTYLRYACFRFADFTFGVSVSLLAGMALFGSGFVIPSFTGRVLQYPVWHSGLLQLHAALYATLSILVVGAALRFTKVPSFFFVFIGLLLFGTAMWNLGKMPSDASFGSLIPWLIFRGLAVGCLFLPLTLLTLTCVPAKDNVAASGLFNFGRQLGALAGVAWMETLLDHLTSRNQTVLGEALSWLNPQVAVYGQSVQNALTLNGTPAPQVSGTGVALMLREAQRQMAGVAFNGCFQTLAMLFVFSLPLVVLARVLTARFLKEAS